ncbi:hypothetical protein SCLCIDRAFT_136462 [Scleroderma citrinum Foug A]|uniref:AMP-dependent synthetase/ligase domain-containing protein n=1 Tax=Scleroderma citrinum Foug A TaxID=1036808 RepID=A0A0C2ZPY6_9AGAM|nr:hypothetical protein SCLCIDRAFT_136462 [Scleroderma citrinum Foug A]
MSLFPPLPHMPEQNVHHILLDRPDQASWRDFTFQVDILTGEQRSFRQFIERVRDGATALGTGTEYGGLGLRSENNEIVGILSENCLDYVALIHSLLAIAVPFATFSSYSTSFEFQYSINLSGATRLFVSPALLHLAQVSGLPDDHIHILEGNVEGYTSYATLVDRVRQNKIPRLPVRHAKKDTLAYLVFSSGTTGLPKAVMITHGNLLTSIIQYMIFGKEVTKAQGPRVWNGPDGMQVLLNVLPIHHTYGLNVATFRCFFERVTLLFLSKWNADTFLDSIPKYRVTTLVLVPSLIYQIVHHPRFSSVDFSTVQAVQCGAAYLPVQLSERLRSRIPSVQRIGGGYGMSECTLAVSLMPVPGMLGGRARNVPGSIGMLIPGIEARVMREDGTLADINETGELYVRGGCVSPGYWRNEAATKAAFVDGWLRTGDHIRIDSDGVLYFEDRAKDTLKVSGMQVSPMEIENTIFDHPDKLVDDVTVAGISGGRTADERVPRAWVVLSPAGMQLGAAEATRQIDRWVRERLSRYKWLRGGIAVVNEIPKSSTGKVLRRQLVDRYEAERTAPMARL